MNNSSEAFVTFITWLNDKHTQIRKIETEGKGCLKPGDDKTYREKMRCKAELLAGLESDAETLLARLPQAARVFAKDELATFSRNAREALDLNSVFYMAQLLYPEDYVDGEPDNLQLFIEELKDFSS